MELEVRAWLAPCRCCRSIADSVRRVGRGRHSRSRVVGKSHRRGGAPPGHDPKAGCHCWHARSSDKGRSSHAVVRLAPFESMWIWSLYLCHRCQLLQFVCRTSGRQSRRHSLRQNPTGRNVLQPARSRICGTLPSTDSATRQSGFGRRRLVCDQRDKCRHDEVPTKCRRRRQQSAVSRACGRCACTRMACGWVSCRAREQSCARVRDSVLSARENGHG